tara:strand:- start:382 stop:723 length:342 start_codon:yes stop_codon:yes gene_type:complete
MKEKKIRELIQPTLNKQTLFQLSQLKSFVDSSLKEALSNSFESEADKIKYLLNTLYNIRDFVLTQAAENSVRLALIQQFEKIKQEEILGNDTQQQEEKLSQPEEEKLDQDLLA